MILPNNDGLKSGNILLQYEVPSLAVSGITEEVRNLHEYPAYPGRPIWGNIVSEV